MSEKCPKCGGEMNQQTDRHTQIENVEAWGPQADMIYCLRRQLSQRDQRIAELEAANAQAARDLLQAQAACAALTEEVLRYREVNDLTSNSLCQEESKFFRLPNPGAALLDELARLQAIIARLPKTADGVPVTPGMDVWRYDGFMEAYKQCLVRGCGIYGEDKTLLVCLYFHDWNEGHFRPDATYSTRAAAESAKDAQKGKDACGKINHT